ncbi:guanylate cyclase activator 2B [Macrotis lagotis]|uniref:guanylate cyclase activator 2B n=1 Tax=Macrotis lagotis TaxID=92651 RepID=UPI003D68B573
MKVLTLSLVVAAMLLMLAQNTQSVFIQFGSLKVTLESVKSLEELGFSPQERSQHGASVVCNNPNLPSDLKPVCQNDRATLIFKALRNIAQDDCELCINVACTGCS